MEILLMTQIVGIVFSLREIKISLILKGSWYSVMLYKGSHDSELMSVLFVIACFQMVWYTPWPKPTWWKKFHFVYISRSQCFFTVGDQGRNSSRAETWRQKLLQRPWKSTGFLLMIFFACLILAPNTTYLRITLSPGLSQMNHQSRNITKFVW